MIMIKPPTTALTFLNRLSTSTQFHPSPMRRPRKFSIAITTVLGIALAYLYININRGTMPVSQHPQPLPRHSPKCIVVGAGLAGLSAASQLLTHNIPVLLLERAAKPGGNSIKASSGINGAPTRYQSGADDAFFSDTVKSAGKAIYTWTTHREKLIGALTDQSAGAIDWLVDEKFVDLSQVAILGGHSVARTHRGKGGTPPGYAIISALLNSLEKSPLFRIRTECTVTEILKEKSSVSGVRFKCKDGTEDERANGPVVFAAGGFGGDTHGLLTKHRPDLSGFPATVETRPGAQPLLTEVGAQLIDMDLIQVHPTGFVDPAQPTLFSKFLAAEVLRGEGGILMRNGERFVNELDMRENVTSAITALPSNESSLKQWDVQLVLDESVYQACKSHVDFYIFKGLMKKTHLSELGPAALTTLQNYVKIFSGGQKDEFGRSEFSNWGLSDPTPESVVYVGTVTPVVHFTMGGVVVDENAQVLDKQMNPIEGLWAAGEITGGVHGTNRLGGSSLLECVVFGRIAGNMCATYIGKEER
ncbi:unnamed protein product [Periconia digitata]|uniref:Fumarate reductase n=1 Tax=Periconia digitata TaxID=1303443 RepID=A0A9W4UTA1_9PLEO|nr:unnamed protein product [Periconia digitata]